MRVTEPVEHVPIQLLRLAELAARGSSGSLRTGGAEEARGLEEEDQDEQGEDPDLGQRAVDEEPAQLLHDAHEQAAGQRAREGAHAAQHDDDKCGDDEGVAHLGTACVTASAPAKARSRGRLRRIGPRETEACEYETSSVRGSALNVRSARFSRKSASPSVIRSWLCSGASRTGVMTARWIA